MNKVIKINPNDNLVVALENLKKGEIVSVEAVSYTHLTLPTNREV